MASDSTNELLSTLEQAVRLLRDASQQRWADWLDRDRKLIAGGDFYGVEHLLQAFGGMGSINDIALSEPSKNAALGSLLNRSYEIASELRQAKGGV